MVKEGMNYIVSLSFGNVSLPPFRDILVLAKKCPYGKIGVSKCLQLLEPDRFDLLEPENDVVEAILVSKQLLTRMPAEKLLEILREKVFPFISLGEIVKIDFNIKVSYDKFQVTME